MRRLLILLLFVTPVLAQEGAQEASPSLAEMARKERERRAQLAQQQAEAGKVVRIIATRPSTADEQPLSDFKGLISTSTTGISRTTAGAEGEAAGGEVEAEGEDQSDPAFWAPKFAQAKQTYTLAVQKVMVLQLTVNDLRNSYFSESDGTRQGQIQQQLQAAQQDLQNTGSEIAAARQAIDALRSQAASAGVPTAAIQSMVGTLPQPPATPGQ